MQRQKNPVSQLAQLDCTKKIDFQSIDPSVAVGGSQKVGASGPADQPVVRTIVVCLRDCQEIRHGWEAVSAITTFVRTQLYQRKCVALDWCWKPTNHDGRYDQHSSVL